jgi:predicted DCC family thiol-disulfide oxidoreductase YuxK
MRIKKGNLPLHMMQVNKDKPILLFDGVCNLCTGSVQFIIRRDPKANIQFASLQSAKGKELLKTYNLPQNELKSLVFIEKGKAYTRSTGALMVTRYLSGAWPLLYSFIIFPAFIRNALYDFVGKNRYKWFGEKNECWVPTPELKKRFIV